MALIACPECGAKVSDQAPNCIHCGFPLAKANGAQVPAPEPSRLLEGNPNYNTKPSGERSGLLAGNPNYDRQSERDKSSYYQDRTSRQVVKSAKSRGIYIILALFFGFLGVHNFYAGYLGRGFAQFLIVATLGWFVVGFVIVFIWILIELFTVTHDSVGDRLV